MFRKKEVAEKEPVSMFESNKNMIAYFLEELGDTEENYDKVMRMANNIHLVREFGGEEFAAAYENKDTISLDEAVFIAENGLADFIISRGYLYYDGLKCSMDEVRDLMSANESVKPMGRNAGH